MKAGLVPKPSDSKTKAAFGTNTTTATINTNRRDSIGSVTSHTGSSSNHHVINKNRLSLPKSLPSSTVVTKSKVERRRSIRRASIARENEPIETTPSKKRKYNEDENEVATHGNDDKTNMNDDNYSPPETRSATKKKKSLQINPDFFHDANRNNALLQFSPPDQARNAQQEQERIQQKEAERYVCIYLLCSLCILNRSIVSCSLVSLTDLFPPTLCLTPRPNDRLGLSALQKHVVMDNSYCIFLRTMMGLKSKPPMPRNKKRL